MNTKIIIPVMTLAMTLVLSTHTKPIKDTEMLPQNRPNLTVVETNKAHTPQTEITHTLAETSQIANPQKTAPKPITPTASKSKPSTPKPTQKPKKITTTQPKNGDTRVINGKKQGYLKGFGWVDNQGENKSIYLEDMYENGNKVGVMD